MANITIENGIYSNLANAYSNGSTTTIGLGKITPSVYAKRVNNLEDEDEAAKLFDAVQIDWNGAYLDSADIRNGGPLTINTTGDLMTLVNEMQKEIYVLSAAVIALSQQ